MPVMNMSEVASELEQHPWGPSMEFAIRRSQIFRHLFSQGVEVFSLRGNAFNEEILLIHSLCNSCCNLLPVVCAHASHFQRGLGEEATRECIEGDGVRNR